MAIKPKHGAYAAAVFALVSTSEGVRQTAYPDPATRGKPWTVCYGETKGVKRGDHHTLAECRAMLDRDLAAYAKGVEACTKRKEVVDELGEHHLPDGPKAAFVSFAYNLGVGGYCRSSVRRLWDQGDRRGACNALLKYNRAAGIVFPGLTYRRERERGFCLEGL